MTADVSLAVWNVFQGLHHSSRRPRWVMNEGLTEKIASLDADVLVLPELWQFNEPDATLAHDVASALGYHVHQWISDRPSTDRDTLPWQMAVLTRIPAKPLEPIVMPQLGHFGRRAAVCVHLTDLDLKLAGLHLYGIHLWLRNRGRCWGTERRSFREIAEQHDIVAGDLNMWSRIVHRGAPNLRPAAQGRTYPASRPHSQIDHILVSDRIEVLRSERMPEMGSDHRALRVVLRSVRPDGDDGGLP